MSSKQKMRDFGSCFSERAVKVSDTTCSGSSSSSSNSNRSNSNSSVGKLSVVTTTTTNTAAVNQSVQTAISSLYRSRLASIHKDVLMKITWSQTAHMGTVLSVGVDVNDPHLQWQSDPNSTSNCHILSKEKGSQSFLSGRSVVVLYWNYSKINSGPEPVSKFYVIVLVDEVPALLLGDSCGEFIKKLNRWSTPIADVDFSLVSRTEQVVWQSFYSTRARFDDGGKEHEMVITCKGGAEELVVMVDKKRVVRVRRLRWNFRGNQTIFLDGLPVDMMWDVGNWYLSSSPPGGSHAAVFMFRRRSALQSRLWLEEEEAELHKGRGVSSFSLLIQAFKNHQHG